jgi:hypothetical protein
MVQQLSGHALPPELFVHCHTVDVAYVLRPFHSDKPGALSGVVLMDKNRNLTPDTVCRQDSVVAIQHGYKNSRIIPKTVKCAR